MIWDRKKQEFFDEVIYKEEFVSFVHKNLLGQFLMSNILCKSFVSLICAVPKYWSYSRKDIKPFIEKFKIDEKEFLEPVERYKNFAEFFIRKLKPGARKINDDSSVIVSPADGQITVFENIGENTKFRVKGVEFSLETLLTGKKEAQKYVEGSLAIVYLAPYNYHRFHYPVSGYLENIKRCGNKLFSVNAYALENGFRPFDVNVRDIATITSDKYEEMKLIEVGAFYVGRIVQTNTEKGTKEKGAEKGYFGLGASTVIMIFKKGKVRFDSDIIDMNKKGHTVKIQQGERIAEFS